MALADPNNEADSAFLQFLMSEEQNARDDTLDQQRAAALDAYQGEPYGDEQEGRSKLVTRDVAEVCDYSLISILRTLISGDRIVQFEAKDQEHTQAADDASELIQFDFMRRQGGYRILHDWLKMGLLEKTGVAKTLVEERSKTVELELPEEAFQPGAEGLMVDGQPVVGELEHLNADEVALDPMSGIAMPAPPIYRATVRQLLPPRFLTAIVPNEEFGCSPDTYDLDDSPYLFHAQPKSLSDLRKMGFQFEDDEVWSAYTNSGNVISQARDAQRGRSTTDTDARKGPMRKVWFREEYCFYDRDGDGIAERIKVQRVGRHIFSEEPIDDQPFVLWCPYPMAARLVGQSLADKTMDIQRVRSVMLRQGMDSLYLSTNPRTLIHEQSIGDNTIDDLLTVRSGGLIRHTGTVLPQPWATLPVHGQAFEAMEMMANERESRTGVTRLNQGLDTETFDRTASGTAMIQAAGAQMQEYCGRNFVEAFRVMAEKMYRNMRRYGQPTQIMVDGKPRMIDPRTWPEEIDVQVRVGLGTGNNQQQIAYLSQLIESMIEAIDRGSPLVTWANVYNASKKLIGLMQVGSPSDYITEPSAEDPNAPKQEQPDPEAIRAQAEAAVAQAKQQGDQQQAMAKLQLQQEAQQASDALKAQANEQSLQAAREKTALDMQLAREKAEFEAQLAQQTADREYALAIQRMERDYELKRQQNEAMADSGLSNNRPGGSLAE